MGYVKGCDIGFLSEKKMSREDFAQGFEPGIPVEQLKAEVRELLKPFVNAEGKEQKYTPGGRAYALYKKIDGQKRLIAVALVRRVAEPKPADQAWAKTFFGTPTDVYELAHFYRQPGFEAEATYFEETLLGDMRQAVGSGDVREARWGDWLVRPTERKKFGAMDLGRLAYFVGMTALWGVVFKNIGLGICYGLLFSMSFTAITSRARAETVPAKTAETVKAAESAENEVIGCRSKTI